MPLLTGQFNQVPTCYNRTTVPGCNVIPEVQLCDDLRQIIVPTRYYLLLVIAYTPVHKTNVPYYLIVMYYYLTY